MYFFYKHQKNWQVTFWLRSAAGREAAELMNICAINVFKNKMRQKVRLKAGRGGVIVEEGEEGLVCAPRSSIHATSTRTNILHGYIEFEKLQNYDK